MIYSNSNWRLLLQKTLSFGCCFNESSSIVVVGIPMDLSATYKPGTRLAPERIRIVACNLELYSLTADKCLENVCFNDLGDIILPPGDLSSSMERIRTVVENIYREHEGKILSFIGGEHLITYSIVKALRDEIDTIVVFDAHLDLRNEYMGSKWNHSTVFRRLIEETEIPIVFIGSRAISDDELRFLKERSNIEIINSFIAIEKDMEPRDLGKIYLSIDIDVIDPGYAPGVANPEPLGLSPFRTIKYLRDTIRFSKKLVGFDIVEVNPLVDTNDITSSLASKIIYELVGLAIR